MPENQTKDFILETLKVIILYYMYLDFKNVGVSIGISLKNTGFGNM